MSVSRPVTSQTTSNQPGAPTCRAMIEETMKMPEPIIEPATSMVESSKPRPLTNFSSAGVGEVIAGELIINQANRATPKRSFFQANRETALAHEEACYSPPRANSRQIVCPENIAAFY